ncbi:UPF0158 family protein [Paucisalibacillus globulus]|uniref:UPF0158 family protein n=1 Tax=Paucisalibacillus globulus TaxID=351095 RepID=UPI00040F7FE3|nr:UPF0158 family protein [Paucisalibacillus globulus]
MSIKVKIDDIVEGLEFQMDDYSTLLNTKTSKVVSIANHYLGKAEDGEYDEAEDLDDEEEMAYDIVENWDDYEDLPSTFDINEYEMIEDFCFTISSEAKKDRLLRAIQGKGTFKRFKDTAHDLGLIEDWYKYRENCYKQIAIRFCEELDLEYME